MSRFPRAVMPGVPHQVTQRGNRRQSVFFDDDDYRLYVELMAECCADAGVTVCRKFGDTNAFNPSLRMLMGCHVQAPAGRHARRSASRHPTCGNSVTQTLLTFRGNSVTQTLLTLLCAC